MNNNIPRNTSGRKLKFALILWPLLLITIIEFVIYIFPSEKDEPGRINKIPEDRTAVVKAAIKSYYLDTNDFPFILNDLVLDPGIEGWAGPYLKPSQIKDPNGNPFNYLLTGKIHLENYMLKSYGADGKPGGEGYDADIIND